MARLVELEVNAFAAVHAGDGKQFRLPQAHLTQFLDACSETIVPVVKLKDIDINVFEQFFILGNVCREVLINH